MIKLLQTAFFYVQKRMVKGIRVSTRPDCIDETVLTILKQYGVTAIELGAQSMSDDVLKANNRGHTAKAVINGSKLIKQFGFELGLQMMTGLYLSDDKKDMHTARQFIALKPKTVRIYPTIVMKGTELAQLYRQKKYIPESLEHTVWLCADLLDLFEQNDISVIRLGLHSSDAVSKDHIAGPWHPAFAQLCQSERIKKAVLGKLVLKKIKKGNIIIEVNPKDISTFVGQNRCNLVFFKENGYDINFKENSTLKKNSFIL